MDAVENKFLTEKYAVYIYIYVQVTPPSGFARNQLVFQTRKSDLEESPTEGDCLNSESQHEHYLHITCRQTCLTKYNS